MSQAGRDFVAALEGFWLQVHEEERSFTRRWEITPLQGLVLRMALWSGGVSMSSLAQKLGIRPQTLTYLVDVLERRGWIRRVRSSEDRRVIVLQATVRGEKLSRDIREAFSKRMELLLSVAPEEDLRAGARALRTAREAHRQANPGRKEPAPKGHSSQIRKVR